MKMRTRILRLLFGVALLAGLAAAVLFLTRQDWKWSLAVGVAAVLVLLAFTFLQPPIWLRVVVDLVLVAGAWWVWRSGRAAVTDRALRAKRVASE
jgi:hypothetical protein